MPRPISSPVAAPTGDTTSRFEEALARATGPGPVGVAVSGGGDSLALLDLAICSSARHGHTILAATVDHGLRAESAHEAALVAAFCAERQIPHAVLTIASLAGQPGNLSALAREERYGALSDWATGHGCGQVLLGHTMDDQAETVLMRLARGSGVEGLSGMAGVSERLGIRWLRPLLGVRRAALRAWLRDRGINWIEDPTNDDPAYDRIKARAALTEIASLGITVDGLAATADRLRRQRAVLEDCADTLSRTAVFETPDGGARIDRGALRYASSRFLRPPIRNERPPDRRDGRIDHRYFHKHFLSTLPVAQNSQTKQTRHFLLRINALSSRLPQLHN